MSNHGAVQRAELLRDAGPDMLAALKDVQSILENLERGGVPPVSFARILARVTNVIAKAEGRTP